MFKLDLEKAEEPEIKLPTSVGSSEKQENNRKQIDLCFIDYAKAFNCVDHNKLWKILQEMGIPDHLTCLLRNLYAGQEATVRTGYGTSDWFLLGIFSPGLRSNEPERMTLGQSLARTDKFISEVKPFYRSRNKELRVYSQQSTYGVNT